MMTQHTEQAQNTSSTASRRETIVLIDGHAMIHRAFHAVPENLTTKSGEPINATFGFTNILIKALGDVKPDYIAVTFDRAAPTFRHEQFAAYKAHRPTLPDNMRPQFGRIGEKTASKLLAEYGDLEGVLAHVDELKSKEQRLLRDAADQARQSKYLATIVLDAPVQLDLQACRVGNIHRDKV